MTKVSQALSTSDAAVNWGKRALAVTGITLGLSAVLGLVTWLLQNWYVGVIVALASWTLLPNPVVRACCQGRGIKSIFNHKTRTRRDCLQRAASPGPAI